MGCLFLRKTSITQRANFVKYFAACASACDVIKWVVATKTQAERQAHELVEAIQNELLLGTKHFDARDVSGKPITDVGHILTVLVDGHLMFEPTEDRREIFRGYCTK